MANVLLLRASSEDSPDRYHAAFSSLGYSAVSIPVLETVFVNLDQLEEVLSEGPVRQGLHGAVVTSARSCEAWRSAVKVLIDRNSSAADDSVDWSHVPFYAVGESTAAHLAAIAKDFDSPYSPRTIKGGGETGTSEKLAHFILDDLGDRRPSGRLLYLTGDKNRDTLPSTLEKGGVGLESLQVYATQGSSAFPGDLEKAMNAPPSDSARWWIVYFAPSSAAFVTPFLRRHFNLPGLNATESTAATGIPTRVAAIGPTSAEFVRDSLHVRVDVVSPKPSAEELAKAIAGYDTALDSQLR